MNIYSLLENKLEGLSTIREIIVKKEYEKLYEEYTSVIENLLFLETKKDFF